MSLGIFERVETPGIYQELVNADTVRAALNLQDDCPSPLALMLRLEEAAQRIEGLTRMVLPASDWEYRVEGDYFLEWRSAPGLIRLPGLFPAGGDVTVTVLDSEGEAVPHSATVQGIGEEIYLWSSGKTFPEFSLPLKITLQRGVTREKLPADLRAAIITQVEQLVDGFTPAAEAAIVRACSRYGWVG